MGRLRRYARGYHCYLQAQRLIRTHALAAHPWVSRFFLVKKIKKVFTNDEFYAIIHGYALPIILITNFISIAIESAILPPLTIAHNNNDQKTIDKIVNKSLLLCFIPGAIISFIYFNFSYELMQLFYKTYKGALFIKIMAIPSFIAYFEGVFVSLLIATDNEKKLVINTIITNTLHLIFIFILVSIPYFNAMGLVISFSITMSLSTFILYTLARKHTKYKIKLTNVIFFLITYILFMCTSFLL